MNYNFRREAIIVFCQINVGYINILVTHQHFFQGRRPGEEAAELDCAGGG